MTADGHGLGLGLSGALLDTAVLSGGGSGHDASLSFSYANGRAFVTDTVFSHLRGYDVAWASCRR